MHPDHWDEVRGYWKNISKAGKVVSQVRCDFNEKGYQWWEFRYKTILLPGGGYKAAGLLLNIQAIKTVNRNWKKQDYWLKRLN